MQEKVTVISPDKFLDNFVPAVDAKRPESTKYVFNNLPEFTSKPGIYRQYKETIDALNEAALCPNYTFVLTRSEADELYDADKYAIHDGGLYPTTRAPKPTAAGCDGTLPSADWIEIELCVQCKIFPDYNDPFDPTEPEDWSTYYRRQENIAKFLSHAQLVFDHQQRTFQFMLLFLGTSARIAYLDRSVIFATHKFDYKEDATYLAEFLWRLSRLTAGQRGHDDTAERIPHDSPLGRQMKAIAEKALDESDYAPWNFKASLGSSAPWWRLTVKDELATEDSERERKFLVGSPHYIAPPESGRGTRGYIALDASTIEAAEPTFVYLKDAWRVLRHDIDKEGTTLRALNDLKVPFVPTVLHHGDLGQHTTYAPEANHPTRYPLPKHSHYRLVVKEIGKPLAAFHNSFELIGAIYTCVAAHHRAFAGGIIHGDISADNILICTNSNGSAYGMLTGWELSTRFDREGPKGRRQGHARTGTWQFLSVLALNNPTKRISIPDALESFFNVLLYMAIRFLPHNSRDVGNLLLGYFDDDMDHGIGSQCGPFKRMTMMLGYIDISPEDVGELHFLHPDAVDTAHPIDRLIYDLLSWFKAYHAVQAKKRSALPVRPAPHRVARITSPPRLTVMHLLPPSTHDTLKDRTPRSRTRWEVDKETELVAKKLDTHKAFRRRLRATVEEGDWPEYDKCPDQKPKERGDRSGDVAPVGTSGAASASSSDPDPRAAAAPSPAPRESDIADDPNGSAPPAAIVERGRKRTRSQVEDLELSSTPVKPVQH